MNRNRAILSVGLVAVTAISAFAFFDWKKVTIESDGGKRVYKRVDYSGRVRLVKQLSDKPCVQGRNWGTDRNGIWVDDGCRAVFEYETDGRGNDWNLGDIIKPGNGNGNGWGTNRVRVESNDGRRAYKKVDTTGGVRLVKKLSDKPCVQGRSWGTDRNGIWVDDGCRAEFEVKSRNGNNGGREPGWNYGGAVPRWVIGDWNGTKGARGYTLDVQSDGSFILRTNKNSDGRRGYIRGDRVEVGDDTFKLERKTDRFMKWNPINSRMGFLEFNKS